MSDEYVPKYGKKDVAFAGAELNDAWIALGSIFVGMVAGSVFGWVFYVGIPLCGYVLTKMYIAWKEENLPGYIAVVLYRLGISGYSSAFNRKQKLFIGDSKVVNPSALEMGALVRAEAAAEQLSNAVDVEGDMVTVSAEADDDRELVN
ncbi:hypothetical protein [Massilia sp.]|uniref:hypothetical protein n=1 Tax=Massilia sp. TaxID=1882437 RepID=UPI00352FE2F1